MSAHRGHDLTPSEIALARVLVAWEEWPKSPEARRMAGGSMMVVIALELGLDGWIEGGGFTEKGRTLLDRARKAGVV